MKVAHLAVITPGRSGLYETTRELVAALRARGFDSRMVDPTKAKNKLYPKGEEDRGAPFADMAWALKADVLVNHSGLGKGLEETTQPLVHVAHGRPRHSFLSEMEGSTPIYSYLYFKNQEKRCKAVVTFWPEHVPYLQAIFDQTPVHAVPAPVDLDAWKPGDRTYRFGGHRGEVNVVCSDMWRGDVDPFVPLTAFALWARERPRARLHLYGIRPKKGPNALIKTLQSYGVMGEMGFASDLAPIYRAADLVLTGHVIDTRSVREAMACGCPVVRLPGPSLNGFVPEIERRMKRSRKRVRQEAMHKFDPRRTAAAFARVITSCGR